MEKVFSFVDKYKKWIYVAFTSILLIALLFPFSKSPNGDSMPFFVSHFNDALIRTKNLPRAYDEYPGVPLLWSPCMSFICYILAIISLVVMLILVFKNKRCSMLFPLSFFLIGFLFSGVNHRVLGRFEGYTFHMTSWEILYQIDPHTIFFIVFFCINLIYFVLRKAYAPMTQAVKAHKENRKPTKDERIAELERRVAELEKKEN